MENLNKDRYVAIMAGGIGSRLWPMSRLKTPKQFLDVLGTGRTMIQETYDRYKKLLPEANIFIITAQEYKEQLQQQLPQVEEANILLEPSKKNTAPCIAYIAFKLFHKNPNAVMIAAPADNLILDEEDFLDVARNAFLYVEKNTEALVTIGIKPTHPNTGYGYIQYETEALENDAHHVVTFTEKPTKDIAETFIASGDFLWNAGIFTWKAKTIIDAMEEFLPEIHEAFYSEYQYFNTNEEQAAVERIYPLCTNISIDFGVMEKAENVYVIPGSFRWSDLGTWNSVWDNKEKDYFHNAVNGKNVMIIDANNCVVNMPDNKMALLQGLEDYIIVDTADVLLICKKYKEQELKEYLSEMKRNKGDLFL